MAVLSCSGKKRHFKFSAKVVTEDKNCRIQEYPGNDLGRKRSLEFVIFTHFRKIGN